MTKQPEKFRLPIDGKPAYVDDRGNAIIDLPAQFTIGGQDVFRVTPAGRIVLPSGDDITDNDKLVADAVRQWAKSMSERVAAL